MAEQKTTTMAKLLDYLPAIYRQDPLLADFLDAFQDILFKPKSAAKPVVPKGIEELIDEIPTLFDPGEAAADFLLWLARWTGLSLRADLDEGGQRELLTKIISLYQYRGTKHNLQSLLEIFAVGAPTITESASAEFQIGKHSTIGEDTYVEGGPPHYFRVTLSLPRVAQDTLERQTDIAHTLIQMEKPAHTYYDLVVRHPSMQVGIASTVGVDTLLGHALDTSNP